MKKLLLATSILAATTGYAAAEITLTGDARMGVVYDGEDVQFSERARVRFNMSGQTDTGLEFGATFRADQAGGAGDGPGEDGGSASGGSFGNSDGTKRGTVWISGAFGKLEMGDTNSAAEEAFGDLNPIGFSGLGDLTDTPFINGDGADNLDQGPGALYSYTMGGFEFHLGMSDGSRQFGLTEMGNDDDLEDPVSREASRDTTYSLALAYSGDNYKVGAGYLDNGDVEDNGDFALNDIGGYGGSQWIVFGETDVAGFGLKAYYTSFDDVYLEGDDTQWDKTYGLSADYEFGATTVTGFARRDEFDGEVNGDDKSNTFGIGAIYDLGGGASLRAGVVDTDLIVDRAGDGQTVADVGIRLNF